MATIDVGGGGRRALNQDLPLIPFIDFLLCLVAFLLLTAVWNEVAALEASALVPQDPKDEPFTPPDTKPLILHVEMSGEKEFSLAWKLGQDIDSSRTVPRKKSASSEAADVQGHTYPDLAKAIAEEWSIRGEHRQADDPRFDQAVLRTDNSETFAEMIAAIDAIKATRRKTRTSNGSIKDVAAFNVTFAAN